MFLRGCGEHKEVRERKKKNDNDDSVAMDFFFFQCSLAIRFFFPPVVFSVETHRASAEAVTRLSTKSISKHDSR